MLLLALNVHATKVISQKESAIKLPEIMLSSEILSVGDEKKWNFFAFLWLTRDEKGQI